MLQNLKISPMFRLGDHSREQPAGCVPLRAYLSDSPSPEVSFTPACSDTQICPHTGSGPTESALFTTMLIYSIHNREALYIFNRGVAQPELEKSFYSSMKTA